MQSDETAECLSKGLLVTTLKQLQAVSIIF
jgi:hypothetical protein